MANIGKNIKLIRCKQNMTQDDLAGILFVSRQTVSNYETGKSKPDIDMLMKIAEALNTEVNDLLYGPAEVMDHSKEKKKILILSIALLLVMISLFGLEKIAQESARHTYNNTPSLILRNIFMPVGFFMTGIVMAKICIVFLQVKLSDSEKRKWIFAITSAILIFYILFESPIFVNLIVFQVALWKAHMEHPEGYSLSIDFTKYIPVVWYNASWRMLYFMEDFYWIFTIPGAVLALTYNRKKK